MSLEWPVALLAGSDQSSPSSSHVDPNDEHPEGALPIPPHLRWRRDALTGGVIGSLTSSQLSREQKHNYFRRLKENNIIICLQEVHGKDEFLQAIQVLLRDSGCMVRLYQGMQMQVAQPFAFRKTYCLTMLS